MKKHLLRLLLLGLLTPAGQAYPDDFARYASVPDTELGVQRAGFVDDHGLPIQISWNETAKVNGVTVLSKAFDTATPPTAMDMKTVLQFGAGNTIPVVGKNGVTLTAIQNTLNNRVISHNTTINATVSTLNLIRSLNLSNSVRNQLVGSIR